MTMQELLSEIGYGDRMVSSEKITSSLKARKTDYEIEQIKKAIEYTLDIFPSVTSFIEPGRTEKEIADFMIKEVEGRNLDFAWEKSHFLWSDLAHESRLHASTT